MSFGLKKDQDMDKPNEKKNIRLFLQLAQHSETAFDELYGIYAGRLSVFIGTYLVHEAVPVEEVLAEVMEALWMQREEIAIKADPEGWMYKIAKNQSLKKRRALVRHRYEELDEQLGLVSDMLTDGKVERDELEGLVWEAVDNLTPTEKEVFLCKWLEGLKSAEIAKRHGASEQTINNQMTTARKKVGEHLAKYLDRNDIEGLKKSNR